MLEPGKKEILERIALAFPKLPQEGKSYVAGYISGIEDAKKNQQQTQQAKPA